MIELTERAVAAVTQALQAARRFDPDVAIRLVRAGDGVRFELAEGPEPSDVTIGAGEAILHVEAGLDGMLDAGEHQVPVLRPFS
jgi:hypothetical protein